MLFKLKQNEKVSFLILAITCPSKMTKQFAILNTTIVQGSYVISSFPLFFKVSHRLSNKNLSSEIEYSVAGILCIYILFWITMHNLFSG